MRIANVVFAIVLAACGGASVPVEYGAEYLGAKYVNDPLGEGAGYDADPLIRNDAFDCQTYVETVLACGDVAKLTQIRYSDGVPEFTHRNHFFSADWVANNSNLLSNVSHKFGPAAVRTGTIDKKSWFKKMHNMNVDVAPVDVSMEYVPYYSIKKFDVSSPMVVAFVVSNPATVKKIGSDILVSHVGLLLPGGVLRHASSANGRVVDTDFREYVATRGAAITNLGVAFFKIKEFCK